MPAAAASEFGVVVSPAGVFEDGADVVAEVALDFEDEGGGPLPRARGLPREELLGEGAQAGGVFPVPMAPKMATSANRLRSGSVSQAGRLISRGWTGW